MVPLLPATCPDPPPPRQPPATTLEVQKNSAPSTLCHRPPPATTLEVENTGVHLLPPTCHYPPKKWCPSCQPGTTKKTLSHCHHPSPPFHLPGSLQKWCPSPATHATPATTMEVQKCGGHSPLPPLEVYKKNRKSCPPANHPRPCHHAEST